MNILIASSSPNNLHEIMTKSPEHIFDVAEAGDDVFKLLSNNKYDCLITEFSLIDIDVWSLSRFVNNIINKKHEKSLPIFVIADDQKTYPELLKANYNLKTIELSGISGIDRLVRDYKIDMPSILIIEDDVRIAEGMSLTLQKNYIVDVCHNKNDGIDRWKNKQHDLILLDLMLPGGLGEDVLKEIREINPDQNIIVVSAISDVEIQEKLILLGVQDYITKPFKPAHLSRMCRVVLTQSALKYEIRKSDEKLKHIESKLIDIVDELERDEVDSSIESINMLIKLIKNDDNDDSEDSILNNILKKNKDIDL